jgi:hypothetical protein
MVAVKPRAAQAAPEQASAGPAKPPGARSRAESDLLAALIKEPALLSQVPDGILVDPLSRRILADLVTLTQEGPKDPTRVVIELMTSAGEDPIVAAALADLVSISDRITEPAEWVRQNLQYLDRDNRKKTLVNLKSDLREAEGREDPGRVLELKKQIFEQLRQSRT